MYVIYTLYNPYRFTFAAIGHARHKTITDDERYASAICCMRIFTQTCRYPIPPLADYIAGAWLLSLTLYLGITRNTRTPRTTTTADNRLWLWLASRERRNRRQRRQRRRWLGGTTSKNIIATLCSTYSRSHARAQIPLVFVCALCLSSVRLRVCAPLRI